MPSLDDYHCLYEKGDYQEAYAVLRGILESSQCSSKSGDMYVHCADLELILHDDVGRAGELLNEAQVLGCSEMAFYYRAKGYVLSRTGEVDKGIQLLEKSVALDPSITNLKTLAQELAYNNDDHTIGVCQRILEQDHEDFSAHLYLVILAARSGDRDKALLMAKRTESLALPARDFFDMGRVYRELGEYQSAVDAYMKASKCHYEPIGTLYAAIAACFFSMGNLSAAAEGSAKAIDLNFNDDYAKDVLLEVLGGTTEEVSLEAVFNRLIDEHDGTCFTSILLAQKARKLKNISDVRELLGKAKQLQASASEMFHIGRIYHLLQCWKEALNSYLQSERLGYGDRDRLYGIIACCYLCSGDHASAIQYACSAVKIDFYNDYAKDVLLWCTNGGHLDSTLDGLIADYRETSLAYIILAQRALRDKKLREARKMGKRAERANPSAAEVFGIAYLWYNLGDFKRALAACFKSEKLGYDDERKLCHAFAECYYSLRNYEASIRYALKALAIDPDNEDAKELLQACREET